MYYAPGAAHAPHHVPKEWADRYAGKFDGGWDAYRETVFARQQEIGLLRRRRRALAARPGRPGVVVAVRRRAPAVRAHDGGLRGLRLALPTTTSAASWTRSSSIGELDNTLIMVISDNGASAEGGVTGSFNEMRFFNQVPESFEDNLAHIDDLGGPSSYNHYPWGWAWAGDTPFRRWKRETYRGGSTDPFILAWPAGIEARGEVRTQYAHAIDMVPTVLDALGIEPPEAIRGVAQTPLEGVSFAHTFDDAGRRDEAHHAVLRDVRPPLDLPRRLARGLPVAGRRTSPTAAKLGRKFGDPITPEVLDELDRSFWELYDMADGPDRVA